MRIVVHAGLHKSGTTTVQARWRDAYGARRPDSGAVFYPQHPQVKLPGHKHLIQAVLPESREVDRDPKRLSRVVARAAEAEVQTLLLAAEDLDRLDGPGASVLGSVFAGHEVLAALTMTTPGHRWASGWQELVKHGLDRHPADAATEISRFACLQSGRVEALADLLLGGLGARSVLIRVVRTDPPEPNLTDSLSAELGLELPVDESAPIARNRSLREETEVLRALNETGATHGTSAGGRDALEAWRAAGSVSESQPGQAERFRIPSEVESAAAHEQRFLLGAPGGVRVVDPHAMLADWSSLDVPAWYTRAATMRPVLDR